MDERSVSFPLPIPKPFTSWISLHWIGQSPVSLNINTLLKSTSRRTKPKIANALLKSKSNLNASTKLEDSLLEWSLNRFKPKVVITTHHPNSSKNYNASQRRSLIDVKQSCKKKKETKKRLYKLNKFKQNGAALIIDEVQTGGGATGRYWCHEHFHLPEPADFVTFSKKMLTGGYYSLPEFR